MSPIGLGRPGGWWVRFGRKEPIPQSTHRRSPRVAASGRALCDCLVRLPGHDGPALKLAACRWRSISHPNSRSNLRGGLVSEQRRAHLAWVLSGLALIIVLWRSIVGPGAATRCRGLAGSCRARDSAALTNGWPAGSCLGGPARRTTGAFPFLHQRAGRAERARRYSCCFSPHYTHGPGECDQRPGQLRLFSADHRLGAAAGFSALRFTGAVAAGCYCPRRRAVLAMCWRRPSPGRPR